MVYSPMMYSEDEESQEVVYVNYKQKYRDLKKHLRALIYENECFQDELRKAQRNFVSISRDKSYLLDRILKYEKPLGVSSDSEETESSEEEDDGRGHHVSSASAFNQRKKITKRKRSDVDGPNGGPHTSMDAIHGLSNLKMSKPISSKPLAMKTSAPAKKGKRPPTVRKPSVKKERVVNDMNAQMNVHHMMKPYHIDEMQVASEEHVQTGTSEDFTDGRQRFDFATDSQMSREDFERHLESRRFSPPMELNTTATVPAELFSQDPDQDSDLEGSEICEFVQLDDDGTSADMILE